MKSNPLTSAFALSTGHAKIPPAVGQVRDLGLIHVWLPSGPTSQMLHSRLTLSHISLFAPLDLQCVCTQLSQSHRALDPAMSATEKPNSSSAAIHNETPRLLCAPSSIPGGLHVPSISLPASNDPRPPLHLALGHVFTPPTSPAPNSTRTAISKHAIHHLTNTLFIYHGGEKGVELSGECIKFSFVLIDS